jgi:hypothetical protein
MLYTVNIFVLSEDPVEAAQMQCDKHVVKMILESGQMLCAAHPPGSAPWKRTHYNHPCTVWARTSTGNYEWLAIHGLALCEEYTKRYGKRHKSEDTLLWCAENVPKEVPEGPRTPFIVAIKNREYHLIDAVTSYRAYYLGDKVRFARWRHSEPPTWWKSGEGGGVVGPTKNVIIGAVTNNGQVIADSRIGQGN